MCERVYRLGRGPGPRNRVGFGASRLLDRQERLRLDDWVLRQKMRWPLVFMVFFHCIWVWKRRTDVSERVYILGRGPGPQDCVGFGVSQASTM